MILLRKEVWIENRIFMGEKGKQKIYGFFEKKKQNEYHLLFYDGIAHLEHCFV